MIAATASLVSYKTSPGVVEYLRAAAEKDGVNDFYVVDNTVNNIGFGPGHNIALRAAEADGAKYHFIVNPDIAFEPGTMRKIIDFMERNPSVGLVMPKTLNPDGSTQYNCKLCPGPLDLIFKRFLPNRWIGRRLAKFRLERETDAGVRMEVPYLCGCFMCFRIEALQAVGLFDERFFMYPEDIDITRRLWAGGWHPTYFPDAEVVHSHEAASYKSFKMLGIHIWNMIKYFNKWGWVRDESRKRINKEFYRLLEQNQCSGSNK